ncbi:MAG TPA: hypothetical protein VHY75_12050, partial [Steroidobacteraceae bacterium]|nr:hypothetical protein [Steroidobacteraceae bacterium]
MREQPVDSIVAAATAPGRGGVAVVRISGPAVPQVLRGVLGEHAAARLHAHPRRASGAQFLDARGEPV